MNANVWERWEIVDGRPTRRMAPGFMVKLQGLRGYFAPGSAANLAQRAQVTGEARARTPAPPPVRRPTPGRLVRPPRVS